ncbi:MAG: AbrB/MazE/SpoVT family DNA-binding domain-containing protein [Patescibacteria group bacterium]
MPRRAFGERNQRVVFRFAKKSFAITLPIEIVRDLNWREGQRIHIRRAGKRIIIEGEN